MYPVLLYFDADDYFMTPVAIFFIRKGRPFLNIKCKGESYCEEPSLFVPRTQGRIISLCVKEY